MRLKWINILWRRESISWHIVSVINVAAVMSGETQDQISDTAAPKVLCSQGPPFLYLSFTYHILGIPHRDPTQPFTHPRSPTSLFRPGQRKDKNVRAKMAWSTLRMACYALDWNSQHLRSICICPYICIYVQRHPGFAEHPSFLYVHFPFLDLASVLLGTALIHLLWEFSLSVGKHNRLVVKRTVFIGRQPQVEVLTLISTPSKLLSPLLFNSLTCKVGITKGTSLIEMSK